MQSPGSVQVGSTPASRGLVAGSVLAAVSRDLRHDGARHVRPPAVSQHLAKLRLAGLVRSRREGTRIHYAAENEHIERLATEALLQADHQIAGATHHREAETA